MAKVPHTGKGVETQDRYLWVRMESNYGAQIKVCQYKMCCSHEDGLDKSRTQFIVAVLLF